MSIFDWLFRGPWEFVHSQFNLFSFELHIHATRRLWKCTGYFSSVENSISSNSVQRITSVSRYFWPGRRNVSSTFIFSLANFANGRRHKSSLCGRSNVRVFWLAARWCFIVYNYCHQLRKISGCTPTLTISWHCNKTWHCQSCPQFLVNLDSYHCHEICSHKQENSQDHCRQFPGANLDYHVYSIYHDF